MTIKPLVSNSGIVGRTFFSFWF